MTDWANQPGTNQTHTNELTSTRQRDESNAKMDYSADSNIPDGTIRFSSTNKRFEIWDATTLVWNVLSTKYLINVDQVDGRDAGNANGNVPISNGTVNTNLNADQVDGRHAGNANGNVPINNGTVNTNLNADMLDGQHGAYYSNITARLGFTPVEQGGGQNMGSNKIFIGLDNAGSLLVQVDSVPQGALWHTGNDGAGSGLDADLLDGWQRDAIRNWNNITNKPSGLGNMGAGQVGTYGFFTGPPGLTNPGATLSGSQLRWSNADTSEGPAPSGTWRIMGYLPESFEPYNTDDTTLWLRIA